MLVELQSKVSKVVEAAVASTKEASLWTAPIEHISSYSIRGSENMHTFPSLFEANMMSSFENRRVSWKRWLRSSKKSGRENEYLSDRQA